MSKSITVSYENKPCYNILLEQGFNRLPDSLGNLGYSAGGEDAGKKACIVTDSNLAKLYLEELAKIVESCFSKVITFCFPAGEESKNLSTVQNLYEELIIHHFDRQDLLIAFGGGVVGDLTGFAAATYLRGIDFVQIPTSLLSQVDSSIGGKTGVDFSRYKNMVGAFYQPRLVYMNLSLLRTLPQEQYISGIGEILKHGLIKSKSYFQWMQNHYADIMALEPEAVEEMVYESCLIKRDVVERDPKERGERALLNFGHTVGHAVEKLSDFRLFHGQCVAIGMAAACKISWEEGHITKEEFHSILATFRRFGLPTSVPRFDGGESEIAAGQDSQMDAGQGSQRNAGQSGQMSAEQILAASKSDKKMRGGQIRFILLESVGHAYIRPDFNKEQILSGIRFVLERHDSRLGR